jgi:hypothetical protein
MKGTDMNTLEMTQLKAERLSEVEDVAIGIVHKALKDELAPDCEAVKLAIKSLSIVAKNRVTVTHSQAIGFGMAQAIGTEKELEQYIAVTNPQVRAALKGKKAIDDPNRGS